MRFEPDARRDWGMYADGEVELWFLGHLNRADPQSIAAWLADGLPDIAEVMGWLCGLDGHFAFFARGAGWQLAVVDRIRSIPLMMTGEGDDLVVGSDGVALANRLVGDKGQIDPDAALSIGMSGYAVGTRTLYLGMRQLRPGECLVARGGRVDTHRYYAYRAWEVRPCDWQGTQRGLAEVTLSVLRKMADSASGRCIVVPLSAGLDSRLLVSGLVHIGYRNLKCFAYGPPGNFEARASKEIARRLGIPWTFVPFTLDRQRQAFASGLYKEYLRFADCRSSVPFPQDFLAIRDLMEQGWIGTESILVNGNSGDFISGGHIPDAMVAPEGRGGDFEARFDRIFAALVSKHFSLWRHLKTEEHLLRLRKMVRAELKFLASEAVDPALDYGLYEFFEWQERQCKYVVTGQRVYEFFGLEWRLPLWDREYVDFWEHQPLCLKQKQALYRQMLLEEDWGGVWRGFEVKRYVTPRWVGMLRPVIKLAFLSAGKDAWHEFERQYLYYWMDPLGNFAIKSSKEVHADRRGFRNSIAWHVEDYLTKQQLTLAGHPAEPTIQT